MKDTSRNLLLGWALVCLIVGLLTLTAFTGCSLPQWHFGQAKIDPKLTQKSPAQREAERRNAALIADLSTWPTTEPVARIAQIHELAVPLSASLGEPLKRATVFEAPSVITETRAGLLDAQAKADKWKAFATKYAGRPIEDTGFNLAGPAGLLGLVGIIALCIACPPVGYLLLRVLPILWGYFTRTTSAISGFVTDHPEAGKNLKTALGDKMDAVHKKLVARHLKATP